MTIYKQEILSNYSSRIVFSHMPVELVKPQLAPFNPPTSKTPP